MIPDLSLNSPNFTACAADVGSNSAARRVRADQLLAAAAAGGAGGRRRRRRWRRALSEAAARARLLVVQLENESVDGAGRRHGGSGGGDERAATSAGASALLAEHAAGRAGCGWACKGGRRAGHQRAKPAAAAEEECRRVAREGAPSILGTLLAGAPVLLRVRAPATAACRAVRALAVDVALAGTGSGRLPRACPAAASPFPAAPIACGRLRIAAKA